MCQVTWTLQSHALGVFRDSKPSPSSSVRHKKQCNRNSQKLWKGQSPEKYESLESVLKLCVYVLGLPHQQSDTVSTFVQDLKTDT